MRCTHGWALTTSTRIWAALPFWDLRPVSLLSSTSLFSLAFELGSHSSSRKASRGGQAGERCCRRRGSCGTQGVIITFTQAPLLRLLQAPPLLPAEGPCSKPAGKRMVRREHKKETYPFSDRSFYFHPGPQLQRAAASQGECLTKFSLHV